MSCINIFIMQYINAIMCIIIIKEEKVILVFLIICKNYSITQYLKKISLILFSFRLRLCNGMMNFAKIYRLMNMQLLRNQERE